MLCKIAIGTILASLLVVTFADNLEALESQPFSTHHCDEYIEKDVAILGGGASGSYAAVHLRRDYNKSVTVIEIQNQLGGHVATYIDPITGTPVNYGCVNYLDYGHAKQFMAEMNVEIQGRVQYMGNGTTAYVDPYTGKEVKNFTAPSAANELAAMVRFVKAIRKYDDILMPGRWNFPAGKDIPADLLMPWPDFVEKYQLQDMYWQLKRISGPVGYDNDPTLFVVLGFTSDMAEAFYTKVSFVPKPYDFTILYKHILEYLGDDVMLSTKVINTKRTENGVRLVARRPNGHETCITAKKLLISAEPSLTNLKNMDLDKEERDLFGMWRTMPQFVFVFRANFIPVNRQVTFMSSNGTELPFMLICLHTPAPNVFTATFNGLNQYTMGPARLALKKFLKTLMTTGMFNETTATPSFEIVAEADFTSVQYNQTADALKSGFIQRLNALQGKRSTWYTGGLWSEDFTGHVWAFTDTVLPRMTNESQLN